MATRHDDLPHRPFFSPTAISRINRVFDIGF
jgi:hypothetical protein